MRSGTFIPKELEKEDVFSILNEKLNYPVKTHIYYDEKGIVNIKSKYGTHSLKFDDGNLYVGREEKQSSKYIEEAECLSAYIQKLFSADASVNPYRLYKKMMSHRRNWIIILIIMLVIFVGFLISTVEETNLDDSFSSKNISFSYLTQYSDSVTIGEAFDDFFSNGKWKSFSDGGIEYVDFTGNCIYGDNDASVCIRFWISDKEFKVKNVFLDGEEVDYNVELALFAAIYSGEKESNTDNYTENVQVESTNDNNKSIYDEKGALKAD